MTIEEVLRSTIPMLNSIHVLGAETGIMEAVKKNIMMAISAIDKAKEESQREDHNEQGKDV
jgi:hypothetical protein